MSSSPEELLALFRERLADLSGEYVACRDSSDAFGRLRGILTTEDWDVVALAADLPAWVDEALSGVAEPIYREGGEMGREEAIRLCARAKAGITGVDAIIADTGTLVLVSRSQGDRLVSLVPPVHIALASGATIYDSLEDYLAVADPALTHQFITGASRTADIEKTLVLGVHGPLELIVFGPGDTT